MKNIKLWTVLLTSLWLVACGTTRDGSTGDDVLVEELGGSGAAGSRSGQGADGAEASVIVGEGGFSSAELDDPSSPLSKRVIYFEYDSSAVRAEDMHILEAHAEFLGRNPNATVRVEGHTDERGSREYNLALGERRALAIRQILMLQGASAQQFRVISFGEERPAVDGTSDSAYAQNRRVELVYTGQ